MTDDPALKRTPLYGFHQKHGARLVPFGGFSLPLHYGSLTQEHHSVRQSAGLFDVSHMAIWTYQSPQATDELELLLPANLRNLPPMKARYTLMLNEQGGIVDDLIITKHSDTHYTLISNAARKEADAAHAARLLNSPLKSENRALLALQGPQSEALLSRLLASSLDFRFMESREFVFEGQSIFVQRSGYTGEDGFELNLPEDLAQRVAEALLSLGAAPCGLGARDTLRLEAGLCLYGQDLNESLSPYEADLLWTLRKNDRPFVGKDALDARKHTQTHIRRGLLFEGALPVRAGAEIQDEHGAPIGRVTSGTYSPSLSAPIAMAQLRKEIASDSPVFTFVREQKIRGRLVPLPFVPSHYKTA